MIAEAQECYLTLSEVASYTRKDPATIRRHKSHLKTVGIGRAQRVRLDQFNRFLRRVYPAIPPLDPVSLETWRSSSRPQWMECKISLQTAHLVTNGKAACGARIPNFSQWLTAPAEQPKCKRCLAHLI